MSLFLKTADTFTVRQSDGKVAVSSDLGKWVSAQFFRTGIWPGQQALNSLMDLSNLRTPAVYMSNINELMEQN